MSRSPESERVWRERVRNQRNSGLSVACYCAENAVSESSFYHWRRRLADASSSVPMPMVEVIATSSASVPVCDGVIEIVLPDALTVRLDAQVPMARLREILAVLRESGSAEARS